MAVSQNAPGRATFPSAGFFTGREQARPQEADWASRLIPGMAKSSSVRDKKPPMRFGESPAKATALPIEKKRSLLHAVRSWLIPDGLICQQIFSVLPAVAADCALIILNWLLIGALTIPLRTFWPQVRLFEHAAPPPGAFLGIALLHAALLTLWGNMEGLYARQRLSLQARILARSTVFATGLLDVVYRLHGTALSVSFGIAAAGAMHFATLLMRRWIEQKPSGQRRGSGISIQQLRNVLIVGAGDVGRSVALHIEQHPEHGHAVCGFLDDQRPLGNGVIGRTGSLPHLAREKFIDEIILAAPQDRGLVMRMLYHARCLHLDVKIVPDFFGCAISGSEIATIGDLPAIKLRSEPLPMAGLLAKRTLDILVSTAALATLAPLFAAIAALIKLDSRGPVFYAAKRAGRKGKLFRCYKFRTMVRNADDLKDNLRRRNQRSGPFFKIKNDPRITRFGHFLRHYSLDELPQLWNVLRGEMSLVGPRPHPVDDVAGYGLEHLARLDVTPGITGLWQVSARRNPSFEKAMEFDRQYIRNWCFGLDMKILFKTALTVALGGGD
jgi:exopolysaccharide biosynthesis polyprenyl glycosylphosphotransferase